MNLSVLFNRQVVSHKIKRSPGFTIVELLVVIVVIGILAAITTVSYVGIAQNARVASLTSDLSNNKKQLELYKVIHGSYPIALNGNNCPLTPISDTNRCLKFSAGNSLVSYTPGAGASPQTYELVANSGGDIPSYNVTESTTPIAVVSCSSGFIKVPGSSTYGTSDFCVMKYEAKNVGGVATSVAAGLPWVSINQTTARDTVAPAACSGCHLITEAEWLTIAQNVLSVPSNWFGNTVGSDFIYSGHSDNSPSGALAASTDNNGYSGTGNVSPSYQRRTLTLTNGEVIWDFTGNVREWTSGQTSGAGNQPGLSCGGNCHEWAYIESYEHGNLSPDPFPGYANAEAASWAWKGIGVAYTNHSDADLRGFIRSGHWSDYSSSGVFMLSLYDSPSYTSVQLGFRVAK